MASLMPKSSATRAVSTLLLFATFLLAQSVALRLSRSPRPTAFTDHRPKANRWVRSSPAESGVSIYPHHLHYDGLYSQLLKRIPFIIYLGAVETVPYQYGEVDQLRCYGDSCYPRNFQHPPNQNHVDFAVFQGDSPLPFGDGSLGVARDEESLLIWRFRVLNISQDVAYFEGRARLNFIDGTLTVCFKDLRHRYDSEDLATVTHKLTNMDTPLNRSENGMTLHRGLYSAKRNKLPFPLGVNYGANKRNFITILSVEAKLPFSRTSRWSINSTRLSSSNVTIPLYQGFSANASSSYFLGSCTIKLTSTADHATELTLTLIDLTVNVTAKGELSLELAVCGAASSCVKHINKMLCPYPRLKDIDLPLGGEENEEDGEIDDSYDPIASQEGRPEAQVRDGFVAAGAKRQQELLTESPSQLLQLEKELDGKIMFNRLIVILLAGAMMVTAAGGFLLLRNALSRTTAITQMLHQQPLGGFNAATRVEFRSRNGINGHQESLSFKNPNYDAAEHNYNDRRNVFSEKF